MAVIRIEDQPLTPARIALIGGVVLGASLLMWAAAKIQVPFYPVPMTLQSLAVLLLGAVLGPRMAVAALVAYLAQGAMGMPVFAGTPERGIGLAYMAGPTGGYMLGWLGAAAVIGFAALRGWGRNLLLAFGATLGGSAIILAAGWSYLAILMGDGQAAFAAGVAPFILGDALKSALAAGLWFAAARVRGR